MVSMPMILVLPAKNSQQLAPGCADQESAEIIMATAKRVVRIWCPTSVTFGLHCEDECTTSKHQFLSQTLLEP